MGGRRGGELFTHDHPPGRALGRFHLTADTWGLFVPELFWPVWGGALGLATLAYHLRRRGRCAHCGRCPGTEPALAVSRRSKEPTG